MIGRVFFFQIARPFGKPCNWRFSWALLWKNPGFFLGRARPEGGGRWISHNSRSKEIIWMCNLIFKLNFKKNQWSFLVPLIGGRWYIIPQLAIYKWYILPIGWLYGTYHLLREPETAIERNNWPKLWVFCLTGDHFHGIFLKIKFGCERKRGVKYPEKGERIRSTSFGRPISINNKKSKKHSDFFFGSQPFLLGIETTQILTWNNLHETVVDMSWCRPWLASKLQNPPVHFCQQFP